MELVAIGHPLDGRNRPAVGLESQVVAGAHRGPIDQYLARPADFGFAASLGPGEADPAAQQIEEHLLGWDLATPGPTVHRQAYRDRLNRLQPGLVVDHRRSPVLASACSTARPSSTRVTWIL